MTSTSVADADEAGLVWLESTGLSPLDDQGSVLSRVEFESTPRDELVSGLDEHLAVEGVATDLDACGEGPMEAVRYPGLSVYFREDLFVGWFIDDSPESEVFRTSDDIGIGSTKLDLDEAYGGEMSVEETSLGQEWMSSTGFNGTLTGPGSDATSTTCGRAKPASPADPAARPGTIVPPGDVAQLARAPALQAGGRGFESHRLHHEGLVTGLGGRHTGPRGPA